MNSAPIEFHKIWIDQCAATEDIREKFGLEDALNAPLPDVLNHGPLGVGFCVVFALFVLGATALVTRKVRLQL